MLHKHTHGKRYAGGLVWMPQSQKLAENLPSVFYIMKNGHFLSLCEEFFSQNQHYRRAVVAMPLVPVLGMQRQEDF